VITRFAVAASYWLRIRHASFDLHMNSGKVVGLSKCVLYIALDLYAAVVSRHRQPRDIPVAAQYYRPEQLTNMNLRCVGLVRRVM